MKAGWLFLFSLLVSSSAFPRIIEGDQLADFLSGKGITELDSQDTKGSYWQKCFTGLRASLQENHRFRSEKSFRPPVLNSYSEKALELKRIIATTETSAKSGGLVGVIDLEFSGSEGIRRMGAHTCSFYFDIETETK
jgi:hypothetical protein